MHRYVPATNCRDSFSDASSAEAITILCRFYSSKFSSYEDDDQRIPGIKHD